MAYLTEVTEVTEVSREASRHDTDWSALIGTVTWVVFEYLLCEMNASPRSSSHAANAKRRSQLRLKGLNSSLRSIIFLEG